MTEVVTAGILVIGDEILSGRTKDKNIGYIADYLTNIGIDLKEVRVVADDGTWGLVRSSSNKPELVVVVESPVSEERMRAMFAAVDAVLREAPEVGAYNQTI